MFEYYGDIHVYCPGVGAYAPLGPIFFRIINNQSYCPISCKTISLNDILKVSPVKCISDLCWPCCKIGQGHPKVIIYIYIVDLKSLMLHAKFQDPRPLGSGEEDF